MLAPPPIRRGAPGGASSPAPLLNPPPLNPPTPRARARPRSIAASICGSFSVISLKTVATGFPILLGDPPVWPPYVFWIGLGLLCTAAPFQLYLLNASLASGQAAFVVPFYLCVLMLINSFNAGILYSEFVSLVREPMPLYLVMYIVGVALLITGLSVLGLTPSKPKGVVPVSVPEEVKGKQEESPRTPEADTPTHTPGKNGIFGGKLPPIKGSKTNAAVAPQ